MKLIFLTIISVATLWGCGEEKDERANTPGNPNQDSIDSVVQDEETSSQAITTQIDEAISAAGEDHESETSAGLLLTNADIKQVHSRYRECLELEDKAVVEVKRSITRDFINESPVRSVTTSFSLLDERTRTWSINGGEVKCSPNKKSALIPWANIEGMTTNITFINDKSRVSTLTNKKKDTTIAKSHSVKAEGDRTIVWSNVPSEENVLIQKSIVSSVSRELTVIKKDNQKKVWSSNVKISSENPLITIVEREKTSMQVVSRTIKSGKIVATGKDGGRIETTFDGVKYLKENKCMASEGKILGGIFAKDAEDPIVTFEITFNGESKSIVYSDGREVDYSPDGCVFDEPEEVSEKESKDEIAAAE